MKYLYLCTFFFFSFNSIAQPCKTYDCAIEKVKKYIQQKEYTKATNALESAFAYPNSDEAEVITLQKQIFEGISQLQKDTKNALLKVEEEKKRADEKTAEVLKAKQATENALLDLKKEKEKNEAAFRQADSLRLMVEASEKANVVTIGKMDSILTKHQTFIGNFYYNDCALVANKDLQFGYLDIHGNLVIDYQYDYATHFDNLGFAKVATQGENYLINTENLRIPLAYRIAELNKNKKALMLQGGWYSYYRGVKKIKKIYRNKQLEILKIEKIDLKKSIHKIDRLENLTYLSLKDCGLDKFPTEICELQALKYLDLSIVQQGYQYALSKRINDLSVGVDSLIVSIETAKNDLTKTQNKVNYDSLQTVYNEIEEKIANNNFRGVIEYSNAQIEKYKIQLALLQLEGTAELRQLEVEKIAQESQIRYLQSELSNTKATRFESGSIKIVPSQIQNLTNLEILDLSYNQISTLPDEIQALQNLKTLLLFGNHFSEIEKQKIKKALPNCEIYF